MCKDYWYHYSEVSVNKSTAVNYINHTTLERETPKAPNKKVTLIETMAKPRGMFMVDGVPVPRGEVAAAVRASIPTTPTSVSPSKSLLKKQNSQAVTSPKRLTIKNTETAGSLVVSAAIHPHSATHTAPSSEFNNTHTFLRSRQSIGAEQTFSTLVDLSEEGKYHVPPPNVSDTNAQNTHNATEATNTPFPMWDKYPHRLKTPVPEVTMREQEQQRLERAKKYMHVYHDDNFVAAPSNTCETSFTRLVLPGYAEHLSIQRRQYMRASDTTKLKLILR